LRKKGLEQKITRAGMDPGVITVMRIS